MTTGTIKIGIVGGGIIAAEHASALQRLGGPGRLTAVVEPDRHRRIAFTQRFFCPYAYNSVEQLVDDACVDLVLLCTPPATHESLLEVCVGASQAVLCEKPLAHTLVGADRMIQLAQQLPGRVGVCHQLRFGRDTLRAKWLLDEGLLGEPSFARVLRVSDLSKSNAFASGWWGRWDVAGGGAVMTQFIHQIDLLCFLLGTPVEVSAIMDTLAAPIESEDTCSMTIRFASGARASCFTCVSSHRANRFRITCDRASVELPFEVLGASASALASQANTAIPPSFSPPSTSIPARAYRKALRTLRLGGQVPRTPHVNSHAPLLEKLIDCMVRDEPFPCPPEEARTAVEVCVAVYESSLTGQPVTLPVGAGARCYAGIRATDYQGFANSAARQEGLSL